MDYIQLIETVSLIVENEKIHKTGLSLVYELSEKNHKQMNEELYYKSGQQTTPLIPSNEFEIVCDGIVVKFIKAKTKTNL